MYTSVKHKHRFTNEQNHTLELSVSYPEFKDHSNISDFYSCLFQNCKGWCESSGIEKLPRMLNDRGKLKSNAVSVCYHFDASVINLNTDLLTIRFRIFISSGGFVIMTYFDELHLWKLPEQILIPQNVKKRQKNRLIFDKSP